MKQTDLFCFPFAGGNKYSFRQLEQVCPPFLRLIPLDYPGRGTRQQDPLLTDMTGLVDYLYPEVKQSIGQRQYAFYGHSMGGPVAFFMIKKLLADGIRPPVHLFVTSCTGPSAPPDGKKRFLMDKATFIQEIRDLDRCPEEILADDELLEYFEPILRADFQVSETFTHAVGPPLDIPITVITGTDEDMPVEEIRLWQYETSLPVDFSTMPGKHFFIFDYPFELMEIVARKLLFQNKYVGYE